MEQDRGGVVVPAAAATVGVELGRSQRQRLPGSLAAGLARLDQGVQILRVHDVAETRQALQVWRAIAHEA